MKTKKEQAGDAPSLHAIESLPMDGEIVATQRAFSVWTAMGIGHSITNTAITILVGLASGITMGGAPLFFWGFIGMILVGLCVAVSLGELASAFPHPGGQYVWVATLAPRSCRRFLSYMTAICGWAGAVCTTASVSLAVPVIIFNMASFMDPSFHYKPWMGFAGYQVTTYLAFGFNLFERCLPWVSRTLLVFTGCTITIIFIALLAGRSEKQSASDFFINFYNVSGWPNGLAFMIGLNAPNWGFSCLDAVVHLAEEIPEPHKNIPKALLCTVGLGAVTGMLTVIAIFLAATDMESIAASGTPSLQLVYTALSQNAAGAIALQILITISAAGAIIGCHTWQSRLAWSFSRDKGLPFHKYLGRLAPEPFGTPVWAHLFSSLWTSILGCLYLGSSLAFNSLVSAGIVLQYITYATSIGFLLWHGRSNIVPGPFWFPRLGYLANAVVVLWTLSTLVFYSFPYYVPVLASQMNYVSCVVVGVGVFAVLYWVAHGGRKYTPPGQ